MFFLTYQATGTHLLSKIILFPRENTPLDMQKCIHKNNTNNVLHMMKGGSTYVIFYLKEFIIYHLCLCTLIFDHSHHT